MPAAKDWNPETIRHWVAEFISEHGTMPSMRDMDKGGPTARVRRMYGGLAGTFAVAGFGVAAYAVRRHHSKTTLIGEVQKWAEEHATVLQDGKVLTQADLHEARKSGLLPFHPDTIGDHFENWRSFLVEAGLARYEWTPAECVQFSRKLVEHYGRTKLQKLTGQFAIEGKTPTFSDISSHYPDIKQFMFARVHWENWQPKKERQGLQECWLGYAALALARADGDTRYIVPEMNAMHSIGIGPAYDTELISEVFLPDKPEAAGVHMQDRAIQIYEGIERAGKIGTYIKHVHPVFYPELQDIGLLSGSPESR